MVSAVKSRPNHYEVLGLAPTASGEEIAAAFAARMGLFGARPWAAAAEISLAFETLRDPAKRRAYDSAIGLRREPEPRAQPRGWTMMPPQRSAVTFARATPEGPQPVAAPPPPLATVEPPRPKARVEPPRPEAQAEPPRPEARVETAPLEPEPVAGPEPLAWDFPPIEERERSTELKHAALVVGVLVLVAGGVGIAAGWPAGGEADDAAGVTVPLPGAEPKAEPAPAGLSTAQAVPVEQRTEAPAQAERPVRTESAEASPEPVPVTPPPVRIAAADPRPTGRIESIANALVDSGPAASDAAEAPVAEAVPADLPLPKSVIARTIERIGFSCGSVASASAVDGAPGVFRIDCSSGQSYRAAPVHGRYHFRRWSGD